MNLYNKFLENTASQTFFDDLREEIKREIYLWEESLRDEMGSDDYENTIISSSDNNELSNISTASADAYKKIIEEKDKKIEALEKELKSISSKETDIDLENVPITCGPYKIAPKKKTAFASVIWALKELNFFIKQEDGSYATNRSDVIDSLLTTKGNADQLLPKALNTDTFMNVFNDLLDKASAMYSKDDNKG